MRAAIHDENLDLPVYVPCRPMEEMNAEALMERLEIVLNSNQDLPYDSTCHINIDAIKFPRGGKGTKMATLYAAIRQKFILLFWIIIKMARSVSVMVLVLTIFFN
jgi:hypothetical protein